MSLSVSYEGERSVGVRSEHIGDITIQASPATSFHDEQVLIIPIDYSQLEQLHVLLPSGASFSLAYAVELIRKADGF